MILVSDLKDDYGSKVIGIVNGFLKTLTKDTKNLENFVVFLILGDKDMMIKKIADFYEERGRKDIVEEITKSHLKESMYYIIPELTRIDEIHSTIDSLVVKVQVIVDENGNENFALDTLLKAVLSAMMRYDMIKIGDEQRDELIRLVIEKCCHAVGLVLLTEQEWLVNTGDYFNAKVIPYSQMISLPELEIEEYFVKKILEGYIVVFSSRVQLMKEFMDMYDISLKNSPYMIIERKFIEKIQENNNPHFDTDNIIGMEIVSRKSFLYYGHENDLATTSRQLAKKVVKYCQLWFDEVEERRMRN